MRLAVVHAGRQRHVGMHVAMMRKGPHRFSNEIWVAPPVRAQQAAARVLRIQTTLAPSARGGTRAGVARARSIARGELQPAKEVRGFFRRHRGYTDKARQRGLDIRTSKALQAWALWGGDSMWAAVERAMNRHER